MEEKLDLAGFDTRKGGEAGFELPLKHPGTGKPLGRTVRVRGYDSPSYQNAMLERQRQRLERLPSHKPTPEQMDQDSLALSAALLASWADGQFTLDGRDFDYSGPDSALAMMQRFPWIREQVEEAAGERGNFLPGSASA